MNARVSAGPARISRPERDWRIRNSGIGMRSFRARVARAYRLDRFSKLRIRGAGRISSSRERSSWVRPRATERVSRIPGSSSSFLGVVAGFWFSATRSGRKSSLMVPLAALHRKIRWYTGSSSLRGSSPKKAQTPSTGRLSFADRAIKRSSCTRHASSNWPLPSFCVEMARSSTGMSHPSFFQRRRKRWMRSRAASSRFSMCFRVVSQVPSSCTMNSGRPTPGWMKPSSSRPVSWW